MPKRNTLPKPDLSGLGRSESDPQSWIIQKTDPLLLSLSESKLSLTHFKILDVYLSRINYFKPENRNVQFKKGEIEEILGLSRMHKSDLDKRLDGLFQAVTIYDNTKPNNFVKIGLFSRAECKLSEDGQWSVNLSCTPEAMEYIFNAQNSHYLQYRLRNVVNLTSRYSYLLFLYLCNLKWQETFEVSLDDLKSALCCTADLYKTFKFFNDRILKKCQQEINEKTEICFEYSPIRAGRAVKKIKFTVRDQITPSKRVPSQAPKEETAAQNEKFDIEFISSACEDTFTKEEIEVLQSIICIRDLSKYQPKDLSSNIEIQRYHYLNKKYSELKLYEQKHKIHKRFEYFKKMIENDNEM